MAWPILSNPVFWAVLAAIVAFGYYKSIPFLPKAVNLAGGKNIAVAILIGAGLFTGGYLSGFMGTVGAGSIAGAGSTANIISVTAVVSGNCTVAESTTRNNVITALCTDVQSPDSEDAAVDAEITANFTLTRTGVLAESCPIAVNSNDFNSPSDNSDSNTYNLLSKNVGGEYLTYVSGTADYGLSDQKGGLSLGFAEGTMTAVVGMGIMLDEESTDELNQYDKVNVNVNFCGTPYLIEYMEMDAAS